MSKTRTAHTQPPQPRRCPCGKLWASSKNEAKRNRKTAIRTNGDTSDTPVRFYTCEHGSWHWTRWV